MGGRKIWVPQPASNIYGAGGADPVTARDALVQQYGEGSVQRAELSCVLDVMVISGLIAPSELLDAVHKRLYRIDQMRRAAANLDSDRG